MATTCGGLPSQWAAEDPQVVATVVEILNRRAEEAQRAMDKKR